MHFYIITQHHRNETKYTFSLNNERILTIDLHGSSKYFISDYFASPLPPLWIIYLIPNIDTLEQKSLISTFDQNGDIGITEEEFWFSFSFTANTNQIPLNQKQKILIP